VGILSILTGLPVLGALVLFLAPKTAPASAARITALVFSIATFGVSCVVLSKFQPGTFHFQMAEATAWIPGLHISYALAVDGVSIWLVMLTTLIGIVAIAMSRYVEKGVHAFLALILALETFMLGAFLSTDLILFFTFFELTLFPMYFLIAVWGGERRIYTAAKFFIYTFAGSIFMLVGIIAIGRMAGVTFDVVAIQQKVASGALWKDNLFAESAIFWSFAIAFLIKAPAFPFHTWMPDTYGESPTVVPVLSSVMVKLGTFGLLRFCLPLFPDAVVSAVPIIMGLAVAGIVYGGIIAIVQPDMRRLVAYSSLSHMGFILLGIFSLTHEGMVGGAYQQISHGIVAGALLVLLSFLYERRQTKDLSQYGGLKAQMPLFSALLLIVVLASAGLPGTNGFVGEFLALMGTFEASLANAYGLSWAFPILAGSGMVLAAAYLLYMYQRLCYGKVTNPLNLRLRDLKQWEVGLVGVLVVVIIWGGVYPNTFLKPMEASLQATRLMAISPAGQRPTWSDPTQEVDLVPTSKTYGSVVAADAVVSPGNLHFAFRPTRTADPSVVKGP
jgi:NADH-quinone oxidoreductase subunit M